MGSYDSIVIINAKTKSKYKIKKKSLFKHLVPTSNRFCYKIQILQKDN